MSKNNLSALILSAILLIVTTASAQTPAQQKPAAAKPSANSGAKKKIKLDYENDVVMGAYDTPDASFINSRRMIKYKELFNRRTNFIEEIDSNKGLFNEYQK